jgi:hypothetical protein
MAVVAVAVAIAVAVNHPRKWNSVVVGRNVQIERHCKENMYSMVRIVFR